LKKPDSNKAVVFDLDDTLYPERQYIRSGYEAIASHLRETPGRDEPFELWLWQRFLSGKTANAFDSLNKHFKLHLAVHEISELVEVYRSHKPSIQLRPGLADLLNNLTNNDSCKLGLISDGFLPAQQLKLDTLAIEGIFDKVILTEKLGRDCWKPSPAAFELIESTFALTGENCTYIADNPSKDFLGPNQLGWHTIQLLLPDQIHNQKPAPPAGLPKQTVNSINELQNVLTQKTG